MSLDDLNNRIKSGAQKGYIELRVQEASKNFKQRVFQGYISKKVVTFAGLPVKIV